MRARYDSSKLPQRKKPVQAQVESLLPTNLKWNLDGFSVWFEDFEKRYNSMRKYAGSPFTEMRAELHLHGLLKELRLWSEHLHVHEWDEKLRDESLERNIDWLLAKLEWLTHQIETNPAINYRATFEQVSQHIRKMSEQLVAMNVKLLGLEDLSDMENMNLLKEAARNSQPVSEAVGMMSAPVWVTAFTYHSRGKRIDAVKELVTCDFKAEKMFDRYTVISNAEVVGVSHKQFENAEGATVFAEKWLAKKHNGKILASKLKKFKTHWYGVVLPTTVAKKMTIADWTFEENSV